MAIRSNFAASIALLILMTIMGTSRSDSAETWWDQPYPGVFDVDSLQVKQSFIRVEGNEFVDENGNVFRFFGFSIADPDKLLVEGRWNRRIFEEVKAWGANTVRIPVHPVAWRKHGRDEYLALIDDAVRWANELSLYLIVDWHSIGYLPTELFQHEIYVTSKTETFGFWRDIAFRYKDVATVAIYELFNEPTTQGNTLGQRDWSEWKALNEYLIDIIYARDKTVIPLIAGFNWAYDLRNVMNNPIEREGVAYSAHPYPQKARPEPATQERFFELWEEYWGFVSDRYPLVASELGWVREDGFGAHIPVINDGSYGPMVVNYMQSKGISWIAWAFDPKWSPTLIEDWDFTPTEQGAFFKSVLTGEQDERQ